MTTTFWDSYFYDFAAVQYNARSERLLMDWYLGTLVIAGPKILNFFDDFCSYPATSPKADGKDILSVTIVLTRSVMAGQ